ncbi:MAG: hypothetical protein NBV67_05240 [Tagaea sp.]|nr:hypothetical protein [Tagaea sp.]
MALAPPPADWNDLERALDAHASAGKAAEFWWRDDDATHPVPAFARLIDLSRACAIRPLIAVIPARAAASLDPHGEFALCQHGWNHDNHAPLGESKAELGPHRPVAVVHGELARGWLKLSGLFAHARPILVPPHNRIAKAVAGELAKTGYRGLSTFGRRGKTRAGLVQVNAHCDIMDWRTRGFAGEGPALGHVVAHLRAKLDGTADPAEPTGLLTHHLAHDEAAWKFAEAFLRRTQAHRAASWRDPAGIFAAAP